MTLQLLDPSIYGTFMSCSPLKEHFKVLASQTSPVTACLIEYSKLTQFQLIPPLLLMATSKLQKTTLLQFSILRLFLLSLVALLLLQTAWPKLQKIISDSYWHSLTAESGTTGTTMSTTDLFVLVFTIQLCTVWGLISDVLSAMSWRFMLFSPHISITSVKISIPVLTTLLQPLILIWIV